MPKKAKKKEPKRYAVVCQEWYESERGWGCRPDGCSLHLSLKDCERFREEYWSREKENNEDKPAGYVPDCYSKEDGDPMIVHVLYDVYKAVKASQNGIWIWPGTYSSMRWPNGWTQDTENALNPQKISFKSSGSIAVGDLPRRLCG